MLGQARVAGVEQLRDFGCRHPWLQLQPHAHALAHGADRTGRHTIEPASLDPRDRRLIDPTRRFHVDLPPTSPAASGANQPADSAIIHGPMIGTAAYCSLTDA